MTLFVCPKEKAHTNFTSVGCKNFSFQDFEPVYIFFLAIKISLLPLLLLILETSSEKMEFEKLYPQGYLFSFKKVTAIHEFTGGLYLLSKNQGFITCNNPIKLSIDCVSSVFSP